MIALLVAGCVACCLGRAGSDRPGRRGSRRRRPARGPVPRAARRGVRLLSGRVFCSLRRRAPALRATLVAAVVIQLLPLAAPLLLSTDAWAYWEYGRIAAVHDANPYVDTPSEFPGRPRLRRRRRRLARDDVGVRAGLHAASRRVWRSCPARRLPRLRGSSRCWLRSECSPAWCSRPGWRETGPTPRRSSAGTLSSRSTSRAAATTTRS